MAILVGQYVWHSYRVSESPGVQRLRQLVGRRKRLDSRIGYVTERLLREGEFVGDIAGALGVSREKIRRLRKELCIPDAREIRRAKGAAPRRSA